MRMSIGLDYASATSQRAMDITWVPVMQQRALITLNNIVIFSESIKNNLHHSESVLQSMQKACMTLNLKKCFIFSYTTDFLGHIVTSGRLRIATKMMNAECNLHYPPTTSELRFLLRQCSVYGQFVSIFAKDATLLGTRLKKGKLTRLEVNGK